MAASLQRPLRIVDVSSFFSAGAGGIKRYYTEKAQHLPALGFECHFVVPGAEASSEPFGAATLHRLPGPVMPGNDAYHLFGPTAPLGTLLRRLAPDVIEVGSHYLLPWLLRRALRASVHRPAIVGFFHSHPTQVIENVVAGLPLRAGAATLERAVWKIFGHHHGNYDATLVASRYMERLVSAQGIPRVHWVGLGVDVDVFHPDAARRSADPRGPVVTYAGRFTRDKELPLLVHAFGRVQARTGAHLRFVGDGPLAGWLRSVAATQPGITVQDYVDAPRRMAQLLAGSDVVAVPSSTETFSLTTAEALACGAPVLGADDGATGELVAGSGGGALFRARDVDSLADTLEELLTRPPAERRAMGLRGRERVVSLCTWPAVMGRIAAVYDELCLRQGPPQGRPEPAQVAAQVVAAS